MLFCQQPVSDKEVNQKQETKFWNLRSCISVKLVEIIVGIS
jgi:hypothetical protein